MRLFKKSRLVQVPVRDTRRDPSNRLVLVSVDPRRVDAVTESFEEGRPHTHIFRKGCDHPFTVPGHADHYRRLLGV